MRIGEIITGLVLLVASVDACMRVTPSTPGMPAVPCKNCEKNLIDVLKEGDRRTTQNMTTDVTSTTSSACAVRTFTCVGQIAFIELFDMAGLTVGSANDDATPGTATIFVTCNAAGTGWVTQQGAIVKTAECSFLPVCGGCDPIEEIGFEPDTPTTTFNMMGCAVRTYICSGAGATITVTDDTGAVVRTEDDGGTGTVVYELTCNDFKEWEDGEHVIAEVKCTKEPAVDPCKTCTMETGNILVYGEGQSPGAQRMTDDKIVTTGACAVRTFTCTGKDAKIDIDVSDPPQWWDTEIGVGSTATLSLTCNADGTGWEHTKLDGLTMDVTALACIYEPPCKECKEAWITEVGGPIAFTLNDPDTQCVKRTFTCLGATKQMVVSTAAGELKRVAGDVEYAVPCNKAGTAWMDGANAITKVECITVGPTCMDCTAEIDLNASPGTSGAQDVTDDSIDDSGDCRIRKLTCEGLLAGFELFVGNQKVGELGPGPDDDQFKYVLSLTCNADGTAWTVPPDMRGITGVQCAVAALP